VTEEWELDLAEVECTGCEEIIEYWQSISTYCGSFCEICYHTHLGECTVCYADHHT
jgi:hypothetical protein